VRLHTAIVERHCRDHADGSKRLRRTEECGEHQRSGPGQANDDSGGLDRQRGRRQRSVGMGDAIDLAVADVVVRIRKRGEQHGDAGHHDRFGLTGSACCPPRAEHHARYGEQRVLPSNERQDGHRAPT